MSKEIRVEESKRLKLSNVVIKELNDLPYVDLDKEIQKFNTMINTQNLDTFGPLIIRSSGTYIKSDGTVTLDAAIIIQAHDYKKMKGIIAIKDELICDHCLYIHYDGEADNLQMAFHKGDLFIYEHELNPTGIMYTLYLRNDEHHIVVDIFKQVVV